MDINNKIMDVNNKNSNLSLNDNDNKKKYALIIGINYNDDKEFKLNGCIQDGIDLKKLLIEQYSYKENEIIFMHDKLHNNSPLYPTKKNLKNQIKNIVKMSKKENINELWFSFSGHGIQVLDNLINIDELDYLDETLIPVDYHKSGYITDDWIFNNLIKKLSSNVNLKILIDSCFSGTVCDLPFIYDKKNRIKRINSNEINANIFKISASSDNQYSLDVKIKNKYNGILTYYFLKILKKNNYVITYKNLTDKIRNFLKRKKFKQKPILSFTRLEEIDKNF